MIYSFFAGCRSENLLPDLFIYNKHYNVPRANPHEVGDEAIVESEDAIVSDSLHDTVYDALVGHVPTHHACLNHVKGRTKARGSEPSEEATSEVQKDVVGEMCVLQEHLLVLVVGCDLRSVNDGVPQDIRDDSEPQSLNSFVLDDLAVAIESAVVLDLGGVVAAPLGLQSHFHHVEGIRDTYANGPRDQCRYNLNE